MAKTKIVKRELGIEENIKCIVQQVLDIKNK